MTRWEYMTTEIPEHDFSEQIDGFLAFYGKNGWELISIFTKTKFDNLYYFLILKRPLEG